MTKNTQKRVAVLGLCVLALAAGAVVANIIYRDSPDPNSLLQNSTVLLGQARPVSGFTLIDHQGNPFTPADLEGKWSFLFFGYTHCPDVCPATMFVMSEMLESLGDGASSEPARVYFVSVDPERDTPQVLSKFVPFFSPDFIGISGPDDELNKLTKQLGILYLKAPNPYDESDYLMDHTMSVVLINPEGNFYGLFPAPHVASTMAEDFRTIVETYEKG